MGDEWWTIRSWWIKPLGKIHGQVADARLTEDGA
jgi:hypothetical protein